MAIVKIDSQGTLVRINTKEIGCLQSVGDLAETRTVTSYSCMSSNESTKALGGVERGALELGVFLDPEDVEGQEELRNAFMNNTSVDVELELSNTLGVNGTMYQFTGQVSGYNTTIQKDEIVGVNFTVEITSSITEVPAA